MTYARYSEAAQIICSSTLPCVLAKPELRVSMSTSTSNEQPTSGTIRNWCPDTWSALCLTFVERKFAKVVDNGARLIEC
jgi:hypothetical protein